jgi:hypothetical protein
MLEPFAGVERNGHGASQPVAVVRVNVAGVDGTIGPNRCGDDSVPCGTWARAS